MKKALALLVLAALYTTGVAYAAPPKEAADPVHKESTVMVKKHKAAKHKAPLKAESAPKETVHAK